ncbi:MAG TPA: DUF2079 domain-containing protein, partial [Nitrososphaerales archaeon]|nr:DUF2079 domain-containing protein [Nitrososphaerales archaeon]
YDFHVEAFVPLEYFAFMYFFQARMYSSAAGVAVVGSLTMEILPVLFFAVAVYFLAPLALNWLRSLKKQDLRAPWTLFRRPGANRSNGEGASRLLPALGLAAASAAAYLGLLYLRTEWLSPLLGVPAFPQSASSLGYVIGADPGSLGLSLGNLGVNFFGKISYWLLIYGLLLFVPLLSPRALLLALPWQAFTLLSSPDTFVELGFQYGFIAIPPLLVGFAQGLVRIDVSDLRRFIGWSSPPAPLRPGRWTLRRNVDSVVALPVLVLVGFNLLASPLNPALQFAGLGSAYRISFEPTAGSPAILELAGMVPANASVVASDNLFPLVANDLNAYSFLWMPDPTLYLPFNSTNPPGYVFISESRLGAITPWITVLLYQSSVYGLRGAVWSSTIGAVLLFEKGFHGQPLYLDFPPPTRTLIPTSSLLLGPLGFYASDPQSPSGVAIHMLPGLAGEVWQGPF